MIILCQVASNLFEASIQITTPKKHLKIQLVIHSIDHEDYVHVHFKYKDENYQYSLPGDEFKSSEKRKAIGLSKEVKDAIRSYCQSHKDEIVAQYNLGKGSRDNKRQEEIAMNNKRKKVNHNRRKRTHESLTLVDYPKKRISYDDDCVVIEMPWIVISVKPQENYTLLLRFDDGKLGVYDMWPLIQHGRDGIFASLEDIGFFMKAYIECDSVGWPNGTSIAPEELYANCMSMQEYKQWLTEDNDEDEEEYQQ